MHIQSDDITTIFDVCLERMRCGESIEACVLDYPSEAGELEPLLIAAMYARSTFRPPALAPEVRRAIQRQLQLAVAARQPAQRRTRVGWFGPFVMRFALALVVALLSLGGGVAAAQSSLPGSSLYPLKRASEGLRLRLASSAAQRANLHLDFAAARSAEILALVSGEQKTIDGDLVDDLDQEYQLAWGEIGQAPADEVNDLARRYVVERRADVRVFSVVLVHADAAKRLQIQRAVRLGEQALTVVAPGAAPSPQPNSDNGVNSGGASDNHQDQGGQAGPTGGGNSGSNGNLNSSATPDGKPGEAGPKATPERKPKATPEAKPADAGPQATPEAKPEDKPDNTSPKPKPAPKPGHGKP